MTSTVPQPGTGDADPADRPDTGVEAEVARVAEAVSGRLGEVTFEMRVLLGEEIAELVGDERLLDLLGAAIEGNVTTVLHMLRHHVPLPEVDVPDAAVIHARRLAQRGVPVFAMVRAYRLGQAFMLEHCFAELADCPDPQLSLRAYNAINGLIMSYIDWVSQAVVTAYETERDQWVRDQDAARAARVGEIVDGRGVTDVPDAEVALRYRLRQHHVAAVLWTDDTAPEGLSRLKAVVGALASELGGVGEPLTVAADRGTTWVWFPRGGDATDASVDVAESVLRSLGFDDVRIALGGAAAGLDGFRDSHLQAVEARNVLVVGKRPDRRVVSHREPGVAAAALLVRDTEHARVLVRAMLGALAVDDSTHKRLRDTLLGFLECGSSYTATAQRHALHKNSVKYRVERALEQRGRPLGTDRIDVELALIACRWLPGSVLSALGP